jgi:hypothetical protein
VAAKPSKGGAKCGPSFPTSGGTSSTGSDIGPSGAVNVGTPKGSPATRASFPQAPASRT